MEGVKGNLPARKRERERESLPCLALPFEGVRLGAELDGRHGGRAEGRSSQLGGPRRGRKQGESGGQSGHG